MTTEQIVFAALALAVAVLAATAVTAWVVAERDERRWRRRFLENTRHGLGRERR